MKQASLWTLCVVEMLERFAYYGLLGFLALNLIEQHGMAEAAAFSLIGSFVTLTYLAPLLGGVLADRVLGQLRAVFIGTSLLAGGYALLCVQERSALYAGLFMIILGHGLFRPAIAAVIANRYPRLDPRKESAFIVFFLAIQLGSALAPLGAWTAPVLLGWRAGFAASTAAMGLALLVLSGQRGLRLQLPASEAELPPRWSALLVAYVIGTLHFAAATTLKASLPLFAREHVDLTLGGGLPRPLAGTLLQGSEVIFQTLLAPIVLLGLSFLRRRRVELSVVAMIGIGMVLVVLPCLLMIRAALLADQGSPVSMLWVLGAHLAVALPNLFLTPMMLVLISQLVPRRHLSTAFALWFAVHVVSTKAANALMASKFELGQPLWYGGLGAMALLATGLWISQVRRIEAARRSC